MTNIMLPVFQMTGPSKDPYPGSFCLTQVPLPVNASLKVGDNATIQVIQVALHGASLYNVSVLFLLGGGGFFFGEPSADIVGISVRMLHWLSQRMRTQYRTGCVRIPRHSGLISSILRTRVPGARSLM